MLPFLLLVSTLILLGSGRGPSVSPSPGTTAAPSGGVETGARPSGAPIVPTAPPAGTAIDVVRIEAADFRIAGHVADLLPGVVREIRLTLTNPQDMPLYVTNLTVGVAADSTPSGCSSTRNLQITQSNASGVDPIVIPGRSSVTLSSAPRAPQIVLLNLPSVNQDVCKNKRFVLGFSGSARW